MSNYVYLKCENLKSEVKTKHKIKADAKIPRVDATYQAGYHEALEAIKNDKGMIYFNVIGTDVGNIGSTDRRRADVCLKSPTAGNFSSIYMLELGVEDEIVGYGNPSGAEYFKPKKTKRADGTIKTVARPNPFYKYRNDGFLFIAKPDFSVLEIIIVQNGRFYIQSEAKKYADGQMNDVLATLRAAAQPVFQY